MKKTLLVVAATVLSSVAFAQDARPPAPAVPSAAPPKPADPSVDDVVRRAGAALGPRSPAEVQRSLQEAAHGPSGFLGACDAPYFADARIAAIRAAVAPKGDAAKAFDAFEPALRDRIALGDPARRAFLPRGSDLLADAPAREASAAEDAKAAKAFADAASKLSAALDPGQAKRMDEAWRRTTSLTVLPTCGGGKR